MRLITSLTMNEFSLLRHISRLDRPTEGQDYLSIGHYLQEPEKYLESHFGYTAMQYWVMGLPPWFFENMSLNEMWGLKESFKRLVDQMPRDNTVVIGEELLLMNEHTLNNTVGSDLHREYMKYALMLYESFLLWTSADYYVGFMGPSFLKVR